MPVIRPPPGTPTSSASDKVTVPWVGPPGGTKPVPLPTWTYTEQPETTYTETPADASFLTLTGVTYTSPTWITTTSPGSNDPTVVPIILLLSKEKPDDDGLEPIPVPIPVICFNCVPKVKLPKIEIKTPQFCIRIFGLKIGNCPPANDNKPGGGGEGEDDPPEDDPEPTKSASKSKEASSATTTISPHCDQHCFVSPVSKTSSSTSFTTSCNTATCRPTVVCSTTVETTTTTTFTTHSATPTYREEFCGSPGSSCVDCAGNPDGGGGKALAARQYAYVEWNPQPDPELLENPKGLTDPTTWPGGEQNWWDRMWKYVYHYCDGLTAMRETDLGDDVKVDVGYSTMNHDVFEDKGLAGSTGPFWGCSGILLITKKGIYTSHVWEVPNFSIVGMTPGSFTPDDEFQSGVLNFLENGSDDRNARYLGVRQLKDQTSIFDDLEENTLAVIINMPCSVRNEWEFRVPLEWTNAQGPAYPEQLRLWRERVRSLGFPEDRIRTNFYSKNRNYWKNYAGKPVKPANPMHGYVPPDNLLTWQYHPAHVVEVVDGVEIVKPMIRVWFENEVIYEQSWCPPGTVPDAGCPRQGVVRRSRLLRRLGLDGLLGPRQLGKADLFRRRDRLYRERDPNRRRLPDRHHDEPEFELTFGVDERSSSPPSTKLTTPVRVSSVVSQSSNKPAPTAGPPLVPATVYIFLTKFPHSRTYAGRFDMFAVENIKIEWLDVCSLPVLGYVLQTIQSPLKFPPNIKVWHKGLKIFGREGCKYTEGASGTLGIGKFSCKGLSEVNCRLSTRPAVTCWQGKSTFVPLVECSVPTS
ncbi:hypothetical protein CPLU01_03150 [Colletotrichum plurivorum]|uniref:Uncharacterized protein n=1 Tax=Colletotrichum plurivorum TaxID=2175906 RepID=A0A8H6NLY5_9PEZI|nr:hypothetical protein CPLU01_03150 [Colletotrichum plurivorum]